jgi:hypothetical protein
MDSRSLSAATIQELGEQFTAVLRQVAEDLAEADLAEVEQRLQAAVRPLLGQVVASVVTARVAATRLRPHCPTCQGRLQLVDRQRSRLLQGLVGDYTVRRPYYRCARCGRGTAPFDASVGLGRGNLSPALSRVACRLGIEVSFPEAADLLQETLGVVVADEGVRRVTEGMGAVAEAEEQAAMTRAAAGQEPLAAAACAPAPERLLVTVDGVMVGERDGWHECKVGVVAPLGPAVRTDAETGRQCLVAGPASYCAGLEAGERFWQRVYVEACRRGLGRPPLRLVVVIGDGADWIWRWARAFLGVGRVEVVEIVDFYHAVEHLWGVANAVFGLGSPEAAAWAGQQKARLYRQGAPPVLAALRALVAADGNAAAVVRKALAYFGEHAQRMDYPAFVARQLPIGSGTVESSCKTLIQQREKGAGMRWSPTGAQAVASLRAVARSQRWERFWQTQPQCRRPPVFPRRQAA